MKLLLLVHRDDAALERFIAVVRQQNLAGFSLLPSSGVGRTSDKITTEFGMAGLLGLLTGAGESQRLRNTTVFSLIHDEHLPKVLEILHQHVTDFGKPGGGVYAVLPVEQFGGLE
jgi:hypothetical protein